MTADDPMLLLPWYVSGTLSIHDRERVRELLASSAGARAELEALLRLRAALQRLAASEPAASSRAHAALVQRVDAVARFPAPHDVGVAPSTRAHRLREFVTQPWLPAAAAGLLVVQFVVVVGVELAEPSDERAATVSTRGIDAPGAAMTTRDVDAPTARFRVRLQPDARAADVAAVLRAHRIRVVAGPDASATWIVELRGAGAAEAQAWLDVRARRPDVIATIEPIAE